MKMMGSYVGLIICTVYFSEMQQHDIVHKAFFFWFGTAMARWFISSWHLVRQMILGVESDTSG